MFGVGRGLTPALVGWLWADLLLGLFVIFLAAASAPTVLPAPTPSPGPEAVDPTPVDFAVTVDGTALLGGDASAIAAEQARIAREVEQRLLALAGARRVAVALAFAAHESPGEGDRLARIATELLRSGAFERAVVKTYHSIVAGDRGTSVAFEVYLFR